MPRVPLRSFGVAGTFLFPTGFATICITRLRFRGENLLWEPMLRFLLPLYLLDCGTVQTGHLFFWESPMASTFLLDWLPENGAIKSFPYGASQRMLSST